VTAYSHPTSDEWLGDVGDYFLNNVETVVRRLRGSEIGGWYPEMQPAPVAGRGG
jgi:hypothetical protein